MIYWRSHVGLSTYLSNLPESKIDQSGVYDVQCWVLLRKFDNHRSGGRSFLRTLSFSDNMLVSLLDMARFQLDLGEIHQNFHQKLELHHDMVVSIDLIVRSVKLWQSKTCRLMVCLGWLDSKLKLIESSGSLASNLTWTNPWTPLDWCSKIVYWRNTLFLQLSMSQTICVITILLSKFIEDWWCHAIVGRVWQFES